MSNIKKIIENQRSYFSKGETKGKLDSIEFDLRRVEKAKIHCAKEHFKNISNGQGK